MFFRMKIPNILFNQSLSLKPWPLEVTLMQLILMMLMKTEKKLMMMTRGPQISLHPLMEPSVREMMIRQAAVMTVRMMVLRI